MPSMMCISCGRMHFGWALMHKQCKCEYCGQVLNEIVDGKRVSVMEHTDCE